ncbi:MAG: transporter [Pseudomonadota bacterium]
MKRASSLARWLTAIALQIGAISGGSHIMPAFAEVVARQSMQDTWMTGPLLTLPGDTMSAGTIGFVPILLDGISIGGIDGQGHSYNVPAQNQVSLLAYLIYGVTDDFNLGIVPRVSYNHMPSYKSSSNIQPGDLSIEGQYRLSHFQEGGWLPTISVDLAETLPTGTFDRLDRVTDGVGSGAYTTTVGLYAQTYFWLPNGHILRPELNVSYFLSNEVHVSGLSTYGTPTNFEGVAHPGQGLSVDLAVEYSISKNWVAGADLWYEHDRSTRIAGVYPAGNSSQSMIQETGSSDMFYVAPSIEYNWSGSLGVIVGVRIFATGRNLTKTITPIIAIAYSR